MHFRDFMTLFHHLIMTSTSDFYVPITLVILMFINMNRG